MLHTPLAGLLAASLLAIAPQPATPSPEPSFETQLDMNVAAAHDFTAADQALNAAYHRLVAALPPERRSRLTHAELAWIAFRDADADLVSDVYRGGSAEGMIYDHARAAATTARTQELKAALAHAKRLPGPDPASLGRQAAADRRLNAAYKKVSGMMYDAAGQGKLVKAELAWIAFRDAECEFAGSWHPGSKQPAKNAVRLAELTEARLKDLEEDEKLFGEH